MELPTGNERYFRMSVEEFDTQKLLLNAARQRDQRNFQDVLIIDNYSLKIPFVRILEKLSISAIIVI